MSSLLGWPRTGRLGDHRAWRPEWTPERPRLLWYLTFEDQPAVRDLAAPTSAALAETSADVIPPRWLHLTLCDIGFADEVDPAGVIEAAKAVAASLADRPPLHMTLGPVVPMLDAVVLGAGPLEPLRELRGTVAAATFTGALPRPEEDTEFWPHVSLCYVNEATDQDALRRVLAAAPEATTEVVCDRLTQALVNRSDGHYQWESVATVSLGSPG